MSGPDPETALAPVPDVPSTARLAWLLFMQPLKLHRLLIAWGLRRDPSCWSLRGRWRRGDSHLRRLVPRLLSLAIGWFPVFTLVLAWSLYPWLAHWDIFVMAGGSCAAICLLTSIAFGLVRGVIFGLVLGTLLGAMIIVVSSAGATGFSNFVDATLGLMLGSILGFVMDILRGIWLGTISRRDHIITALSLPVGIWLAFTDQPHFSAMAVAVGLGVGYLCSAYRLYFYPFEALMVASVAVATRDPRRGLNAVRWLPYRHHDLVRFPLPGLRRVFIDLAEHSPNLARQLIDEASTTIAQKKPAQRAFDQLQARDLRQAAESANWQRVIDLKGNFFPAYDAIPADDPLRKFIAAATDLHAAASGGSQRRRSGLLDKAARQIDDIKKSYLASPTHDHRSTLLHDVAGTWSRVIATKRDALTREIELNPEIPNVFIVGPPLNPVDPEELQLFRARRDLISIIDRDLDDSQRGVLFLVGQRRMGKTSLLAMLPTYLGTATTIVTCDFQGLSGSEHRDAPHLFVVEELAAALSKIPDLTLPESALTDAWGSALAWLTRVDAELACIDHRVLVAIDEVERLQDATNEGWGNLGFLDFVRAAGDKLRRIRLLLVSAHPLANPKLGPAWVDRLISVLPRTLGPLAPEDARALLCRPVPTFPDVFDDAAARTILAHTGRHPFLIQAVGKEVVQRLLREKRRVATPIDVERALDAVIKIAEGALFTYLWDAFDPAEKDLMRALAGGALVDPETGAFRVLREQWFVDVHGGQPAIAFPMFGRWIRDYRGEHPVA